MKHERPELAVRAGRPGSEGEHRIQQELGTTARADRFYDDQVRDRLNERMREFAARQEMFFLSTADRHGECDSTFRAGPPGFIQVLDDKTIAYPEYRGNGVMASVGNIQENPHVGILMIDFIRDRIGLHINGRARLIPDDVMRSTHLDLPVDPVPGRRPQMWVEVEVEEAYIHCSKHIPRLVKAPSRVPVSRRAGRDAEGSEGEQAWGTDDFKRKGGDYFGAAAEGRLGRAAGDAPSTVPAPGPTDAAAADPDLPDREVWRREAERAPAQARRAEPAATSATDSGGGVAKPRRGFRGWFG